ncbi:MAG: hypothetical protein RIB54_05835 [Fulvivirga sp.]|uniref:hypothetical protein n=2 Tax=Fulvivirga sp. TaxID=1931237 RepID=UPI0032EF17FC
MEYPSINRSLLIGIILSIVFLSGWEWYCREQGFVATMEDTKELWAETRANLEDNNPNQLVSVSASRGHFDIQLNEWEALTGIRPLMLSADGRGPGAVLEDIVITTEFNGTILLNVTPDMFFVPKADSLFAWWRGKEWVDYYNKRTYAQLFNHQVSYSLQPFFAFLTTGEEGDPDLKSMVREWSNTNDRTKSGPPFPRFSYCDFERNTTMLDKVVTDTAFAAIIQRAWMFDTDSVNRFVDHKQSIFNFYLKLIETFKARGGKVIITRNPSHGGVRSYEKDVYPRSEWWDEFIEQANCPAYHFEDYPQLDQFYTPEWSHLSTPDARIYTTELVKILQADGVL